MLKVNPHPVPQLNPAVPLPFAFIDCTVKVLPLLTVSPQPAECEVSVALFATPLEFNVNVTSVVATPQPPCPYSVICHDPFRSEATMSPDGELRIAVPSRKFPGFADDPSTRLKDDRSGATWIENVHPHPTPKLRPAVP